MPQTGVTAMVPEQKVVDEFRRRYAVEPTFLIRSPGRVNLIGEHTDYNDGFVMPLAIDRATWIAAKPRADRIVSLYSTDYNQAFEVSLENYARGEDDWGEYVKGMAWSLSEAGFGLNGFDGVLAGNVPIGAGLSSSAAFEMAVARAFCAVSGFTWDPVKMARIGQQAENAWMGVSSGIMDQMISAGGKENHALLIDCRSLESTPVPLPEGCSIVILDTATRRSLVTSAYNERRSQCESVAAFFNVGKLRDVSLVDFYENKDRLPEISMRRARHVLTENERTLDAAEAMQQNNSIKLGQLMIASHESLRDDFEVANEALDQIVLCALNIDGCFGARMTGAGFGGCAVALVKTSVVDSFVHIVSECYRKKINLQPTIFVCKAGNGAALV